MNFYDNYIVLFNARFASPLSEYGRAFYNYFLVDSSCHEGRKSTRSASIPNGWLRRCSTVR